MNYFELDRDVGVKLRLETIVSHRVLSAAKDYGALINATLSDCARKLAQDIVNAKMIDFKELPNFGGLLVRGSLRVMTEEEFRKVMLDTYSRGRADGMGMMGDPFRQ